MSNNKIVTNRRNFSDDFKRQIVELCRLGTKSKADIAKDYGIGEGLLYEWIRRYEQAGSFHKPVSRTVEEEELRHLQKENQQLRMENDILKSAALILGKHAQK